MNKSVLGFALAALLGAGEAVGGGEVPTRPFLHIETGTHTAPMKGIDIDAAGRFLVTGARAKMVPQTLDEAEALRLAGIRSDAQHSAEIQREDLPPVVTILDPQDGVEVTSQVVKVRVNVRSPSGRPVTRVWAKVAGQAIESRSPEYVPPPNAQTADAAHDFERDLDVPLPPRDCIVEVLAEVAGRASTPARIFVKRKVDEPENPPGKSGSLSYEASRALLIGVSAYGKGWRRLPGVQREIEQVRAVLRKHGFEIEVVMDPTRADFDHAMRRFIKEWGQSPDNRLVVYFAGHGHTLKTIDGRELGYIIPVDAPLPGREPGAFRERAVGVNRAEVQALQREIGEFKEKAVSMSEIEVDAMQMESRHVLFVFDSCFSGALFDGLRGLPAFVKSKMNLPVREFITAGSAEQSVPDASIFGDEFVEGLEGEADLNRDGYITGSELGFFLEDKVAYYSLGLQTPMYGKIRHPNLDKGEIIFILPNENRGGVVPAFNGSRGRVVLARLQDAPARKVAESSRLQPNIALEREMSPSEVHAYEIELTAGQYVRLAVEQEETEVGIIVTDPVGKKVTEVLGVRGTGGVKEVHWISDAAGVYQVEVRPIDSKTPKGRYIIKVKQMRAVTERDRSLAEADRLNAQIERLYAIGKYTEARVAAENVLAIRKLVLGEDDPEVADALDQIATIDFETGSLASAESLLQRSLSLRHKASGSSSLEVAASLDKLAALYSAMGRFSEAVECYRKEQYIQEKILGIDNLHVASTLNKLALAIENQGDLAEAESLLNRVLKIRQKNLGMDRTEVAEVLNNLASVQVEKGDLGAAEKYYQSAIAIEEKAFGPEHPYLAQSLNNLGALLYEMGDYSAASSIVQRALGIFEKAFGPENHEVARSLDNLGEIYLALNDLDRAEPYLSRALAIQEKLSPNDRGVAITLRHLSSLYQAKKDYLRAEVYLERALTIYRLLAPDSPYLADTLRELCALKRVKGDVPGSMECYETVVVLFKKGGDLRGEAQTLEDIGQTLLDMDQSKVRESIVSFEQALELFRKMADRRSEARALDDLGRAYEKLGDANKASAYQRQAREIRDSLGLKPDL